MIPDYDAVILDEAHTVESVAGDHLGFRVTSGQVDYVLRRLFNDRTHKGLLVHENLVEGQRQVDACRDAAEVQFGELDAWFTAQAAPFQGRVRQSEIVPNRLSEPLMQLARTIRNHGQTVDDESRRQDLLAASGRLEGLAEAFDQWRCQSTPGHGLLDRAVIDETRMASHDVGGGPVGCQPHSPPRSVPASFECDSHECDLGHRSPRRLSVLPFADRGHGVPHAPSGKPLRLSSPGRADSGPRNARSVPRIRGVRTLDGIDDPAIRRADRWPRFRSVYELRDAAADGDPLGELGGRVRLDALQPSRWHFPSSAARTIQSRPARACCWEPTASGKAWMYRGSRCGT